MLIMLLVREAKETPAEYLTIELLLSGEADFPAMAVATAVAMTAASCLSFLEAKAEELASLVELLPQCR